MSTTQLEIGPPTPVQICQLAEEFLPVLELYRDEQYQSDFHPFRMLEIGTASGGTLYHWLQNAKPGVRVVTVDLAVPDYASSEHLYADWTPDGVTVEQIRGDSHDPHTIEVCRMLGPYQWLFIDGCHRYQDARQDWDDYMPLVEPGGIVLLHDIALFRDYGDGTSAGVWQLWRELQNAGYWTREFRADPALQAYGIGAVRV
jgi:predicted O-methyltransferase YrrM